MRWPRPRFTVRRMMVAVAIVAVLLALPPYQQRSGKFRNVAFQHGVHGKHLQSFRRELKVSMAGGRSYPALDARLQRGIDYHERMRRKYGWAARYPFLPVLADPPMPK